MFEFESLVHAADLVIQIQSAEQRAAGTYNRGETPVQFVVFTVQGLSGDLLPGISVEEKDFQQTGFAVDLLDGSDQIAVFD